MSKSFLVYVNNIPVQVPFSSTVLNACEKVGITIPRFCYHELLGIAGNCRICLVEIEKSLKPQASCGFPAVNGIRIYTNTPLVKRAREAVLEFLLLNHPLDCPICDQGGECDLQNQTASYGNTISRFYKYKRGVEDKSLGPLIKTIISRCIHCTRCIRFASDVAGVEDLGTTLRGSRTEVGTYAYKTFNSEVSANIIDLCPVGALTSKVYTFKAHPWEVKSALFIEQTFYFTLNSIIRARIHFGCCPRIPIMQKRISCTLCTRGNLGLTLRESRAEVDTNAYKKSNCKVCTSITGLRLVGALTSKVYAFKARPWEVRSTLSIDTSDSLGSNLTIETKNSRILRVIPKFNKGINLEWLSDKARYAYDGNDTQRLDTSYFHKNQKLEKLNSRFLAQRLFNSIIISSDVLKLVVGRNLDLETLSKAKMLGRLNGAFIESERCFNLPLMTSTTFQSTLNLEEINKAQSFFLIGVNPRNEACIANIHLRKNIKKGNLYSAYLGSSIDLTYKSKSLGLATNELLRLKKGNHSLKIKFLQKHLLVYGDSLSSRNDALSILLLSFYFIKGNINVPFLLRFPLGSNSVGKSFLGISSLSYVVELSSETKLSYLLKVESFTTLRKQVYKIILEACHTNPFLSNCDLVLPLQSTYEKSGHFINHCGLVQMNLKVIRFGFKPLSYLSELPLCVLLKNEKLAKKANKRIFFASRPSTLSLSLAYRNIKLSKYPLKLCLADTSRSDKNTSASLVLAKVSAHFRLNVFNFIN